MTIKKHHMDFYVHFVLPVNIIILEQLQNYSIFAAFMYFLGL